MRKKSNKTKLTLWIDKNVLAEAREYIPNLSAFVEMKFREYIVLFKRFGELKNAEAGIRTRDLRIMSPSPQPARPPRLGVYLRESY